VAITMDWGTKVISVPQADLTFISGTLYELDTDVFRLRLKDLEDDVDGMSFVETHIHNPEVTIAGVTYARQVILINGYTVTFGDGQYAVRLVGSNNNIFDEGVINRNQVSIIPTNSAGLQVVTSGSGLSTTEQTQLTELHRIHGLETGTDLSVTDTSRAAGTISQTVSDDGTTTKITRP